MSKILDFKRAQPIKGSTDYNYTLVDHKITFPGEIEAEPGTKDHNLNARIVADAWLNNGVAKDETVIDWAGVVDTLIQNKGKAVKDTVTTGNFVNLMETATTMIVREPIEPILAITGLFNVVRQKHFKTEIISGIVGGAVTAGEYDEGGNPPEFMIDIGSGYQVATGGKSGIMAAFTDEALRYASWDLMGIFMRLMAAALARYTEIRAIDQLRSTASVLYDNLVPASSLLGSTSGRDESFAPNGTLTADDLVEALAHAHATGYPIDTMIINPQIYWMWMRDPVMRHFFLSGIAGGSLFGSYSGNPAPLPNWTNGPIGALGESHAYAAVPAGAVSGETATPLSGYSNVANSAPNMPSYWGISLRTIVSPLLPYDTSTKLCDIFLVASGQVGMRIIDEDVTKVEWRDEDHETVKVKFKQRDAFVLLFEGAGVYVMRNIKNAENFWSGKVELTRDASAVTPIDHGTVPSGI